LLVPGDAAETVPVDAFGLELELERIEGRIARGVGEAVRGSWETGQDGAAPTALSADGTRRMLAAARVLPGDAGARAKALWRMALEAQAGAADPARATPAGGRTEAGLIEARDARNAAARRLGFADAWALARVIHGEDDQPVALAEAEAEAPASDAPIADPPELDRLLDDPRPLVDALARLHGVDGAITVAITRGDAPIAGRTYVIEPGHDVRVRVWRRPGVTARGTVRVLLHELGHALLAASWRDRPWALSAPPSRAFDEATAAWTASLLEREAFLRDHLRLADPAPIAAAERAARARRRNRLTAAALAEHAFLTAAGPPPWQDALAWTDPGASYSYAAAETLRDAFDAFGSDPLSPRDGVTGRR